MSTNHDSFCRIIILGCGPSSLSAAVQLARADFEFLIISNDIGGLIKNANLIENFLGFPEGITGPDYVSIMEKTIFKYGIPIKKEFVNNVSKNERGYVINTTKNLYYCEYLIIGTGTNSDRLNIEGEEEAFQRHYLYYDISGYSEKKENYKIGIIGSGDAAYDYALNLGSFSNSIEILQRTSKSSALAVLKRRVGEKNNIKVYSNYRVNKIEIIKNQLLLVISTNLGEITKKFDRIFVAIGRSPNITFLSPLLRKFFLKQDECNFNDENIWFVGDIKNGKFRQLSLAIADGIKAAMQITEILHN